MKRFFLLYCIAFLMVFGLKAQSYTMVYQISMGMADNNPMMQQMMPGNMEILHKDGKTITRFKGGMMASMLGETLSDNNNPSISYLINHKQKNYTELKSDPNTESKSLENDMRVSFKKTGKQEKISGFACAEYLVSTEVKGEKMDAFIWTTNDIKVPRPPAQKSQSRGFDAMFQYNIEGFPVKYVYTSGPETGSMKTEVTLLEFNTKELSGQLFEIPASYKKVDLPALSNPSK